MQFISFSQLGAIIRYEMLIQWRRGSLKMILILLILSPLCLIALGNTPGAVARQALQSSSDSVLTVITTDVAVLATVSLLPLLLFGLPLYVSETIPYDRQEGVRDLLDTLPMGCGIYLAGKVLAVWVGIIVALIVSGLVSGIISTVVFGALDPQTWFVLWIGGFVVTGLFASGLSVLLASGQPNRRRALMIGFLSMPIYFAAYALSPLATFTLSSVNRIFLVTMSQDILRVAPVDSLPSNWSFVIWSLITIVLVWMLTWGLGRWQGNRV
jgi:hypothetical protein